MIYQDIKKKMDEKDSLGRWDDKELIFTEADMHKMIEVQDAMTRDFYKKQISHMMTESDVLREFEKRADTIKKEKLKIMEERPDDKDTLLFYDCSMTECRIMHGLFQRIFTLKYLDEEVR